MRGAATVGCKSKDLLTLEVDVRAYLHGYALSTIADGSGSRGGLLPDIGALGTALFRDACAAETAEAKQVASAVLEAYNEWWPVSTLQQEARRLLHASVETHPPNADTSSCRSSTDERQQAAVRALKLLHVYSRHQERCWPLLATPINWAAVLEPVLCDRISLPLRNAVGTSSRRQITSVNESRPLPSVPLPLPHAVLEAMLDSVQVLSQCPRPLQWLGWLLHRPAIGDEAAALLQRWKHATQRVEGEEAALPIQLPSLRDWVRWELTSGDASSKDARLDAYAGSYLLSSALPTFGGDCTAIAEELFVVVVEQLALVITSEPAECCAAATARLLTACASLGDRPAYICRESGCAGGRLCWMLRAMQRLVRLPFCCDREAQVEARTAEKMPTSVAIFEVAAANGVKTSRTAGGSETPDGNTRLCKEFAEAASICVRAMPWEYLVPHRRHDGAAVEGSELLLVELLTSSLMHVPKLLAELLLALARLHLTQVSACAKGRDVIDRALSLNSVDLHDQKQARGGCVLAPSLVQKAVCIAPALKDALRACLNRELKYRVQTLSHLTKPLQAVVRSIMKPAATPLHVLDLPMTHWFAIGAEQAPYASSLGGVRLWKRSRE